MCAAPAVVLEPNGLLEGVAATAHPAFVSKVRDSRRASQSPWAANVSRGAELWAQALNPEPS
eukprot:7434543-Pyramimonas_sp.AAC.1